MKVDKMYVAEKPKKSKSEKKAKKERDQRYEDNHKLIEQIVTVATERLRLFPVIQAELCIAEDWMATELSKWNGRLLLTLVNEWWSDELYQALCSAMGTRFIRWQPIIHVNSVPGHAEVRGYKVQVFDAEVSIPVVNKPKKAKKGKL